MSEQRRGPGRPRREAIIEVETDTDEEEEEFDIANLILDDVERPPKLKICSQFLIDLFYTMQKELKQEMECIICMDKLECKSCFVLLNCGHSFHSKCLLFLVDKQCPVCRDHD